MTDRHDWNSWDHYQDTYYRFIDNYTGHFILTNQLQSLATKTQVIWRGTLYCVDGLEIKVFKTQNVRYLEGRCSVRTEYYSYHVLQRSHDRIVNLFRYDNVHKQRGHPSPHHRHNYDAQGNQIEPAEHVGEEGWPTLGDVIAKAHDWWSSCFAEREHQRRAEPT